MADGRHSKRLKIFHELEKAPARALKGSGSGEKKPAVKEQVFRFLDLPKELRLRIYEYAFKAPPKGRKVLIQVWDQVYNYYDSTACSMRRCMTQGEPIHPLLLANKFVHKEGVGIFHQDSKFEVRCYADARSFRPSTPGLGQISDCQIFSHVRHLKLNVYINKPNGLRAFINRLRPLLSVLAYGRRLTCLDLDFMHLCSNGEYSYMHTKATPTFEKLRSVVSVFQHLGCSGTVNVHWRDPPSMDTRELCEDSKRALKLVDKLRDVITENGKAYPKRGKGCVHRKDEFMPSYSVDPLGHAEEVNDKDSVDYDDALRDVEWVSEDDEWFSEDEDCYSDIC